MNKNIIVYLVDNSEYMERKTGDSPHIIRMTLLEYRDRYNSGLYQAQGYYLYFSSNDALDQVDIIRINRVIS